MASSAFFVVTCEFVEVDGLADEVEGAELDGGLDVVQLRVGGDHDHGAGVAVFLQPLQHFQATDVGEADVEQNEVGISRFAPCATRARRCPLPDR